VKKKDKHIENATCSLSYACSEDCPHKTPHYTWGMDCNKYRWCLGMDKSVICGVAGGLREGE